MANPLYGAFVGTKWGLTRDKELAISATQAEMQRTGLEGEVRVLYSEGDFSYDNPTFRVLSERIWPSPAPAVLPRAIGY